MGESPMCEADDEAESHREVDASALRDLFESYGVFGTSLASDQQAQVVERYVEKRGAAARISAQELFESYGVFGVSWTSEPQQPGHVEAADASQLTKAAAFMF